MADSAERRAAERMPVTPDVACSFVSPVVEDFGPARVRDVSMDGIGLVLVRPVVVGALLAVGLANPARGLAKTVLLRVTHVTTIPGGYLAGGTFAAPLTYQEFTALVM